MAQQVQGHSSPELSGGVRQQVGIAELQDVRHRFGDVLRRVEGRGARSL